MVESTAQLKTNTNQPQTFRSIQFDQTGLPIEVLSVREMLLAEPKQGQVRIRVQARPINPADLMFIEGLYGIQPKSPSGVGFEGMGKIDAVGEGIEDFKTGMRVSFMAIGTWSEYVVVPVKAVVPIPDSMSDEIAAQLFVNPITAYALIQECGVKPGEWLMFTAAGSTFGRIILQICKTRGIKTIGTVRREDQIDELKALGADEVINTTEGQLPTRVKEITGGKGVAFVLDAVGGKTGAAALQCLSPGGTMIVYGSLTKEPIPLNSGTLIFKGLQMKGFWLTDWLKRTEKKAQQEVLEQVMELLASGKVELPVDAKYDLSEITKAIIHADSSGRKGKVLLVS